MVKIENGRAGSLYGTFSNPRISFVRYVSRLNNDFILLIGDPEVDTYTSQHLWQVEREGLEKRKVAEEIYYTFIRPPMIFRPEGFPGTVLVYYTGSVDWGFGGDSSRPAFSHIRIYTDSSREGLDIAKFGFKAGTIIDVTWKENAFLVTGDPSRPAAANQEPRDTRVWRIEVPDLLIHK